MILRHFYDQDFLLVDTHNPDLLEDIAVADLKVNSNSPLLLGVGERPENTISVECT